MQKIPQTDLHQVTCRAKQAHIKRRQDYDPHTHKQMRDEKRRRIGEICNLKNFPCLTEACFLAYTCPVPEERQHKIPMPGIENSGFPEQLISLPNPSLLEPLVTMENKKLIFNPDADGNNRTRDENVSLETADVANKTMVPLSLMGRDEAYLKNMLWLLGASQVILWGVGNGMLAWVCLNLRIPILCIYDNERHKDVIQKHLLQKILVEADKESNKRFYKSNADLGVSGAEEQPVLEDKKKILKVTEEKKKDEEKKKAEEEKKKAEEKKEKKEKKSSTSSSSSSSSSASASSNEKSSKKKEDKKAKKPTKKA